MVISRYVSGVVSCILIMFGCRVLVRWMLVFSCFLMIFINWFL